MCMCVCVSVCVCVCVCVSVCVCVCVCVSQWLCLNFLPTHPCVSSADGDMRITRPCENDQREIMQPEYRMTSHDKLSYFCMTVN